MFIVFEGIDGSGKSTQARALHRRLQRSGRPVLLTREPGGTPLGDTVRRWVKTRPGLSSTAELFLFSAARAQLLDTVVRPALLDGKIVIADRFTASTIAYQGHGRGLELDLIEQVNRMATDGLTPEITVLLDVDPAVGIRRRAGAASAGQDNFDAAPLEFQQRVRQGYLEQAGNNPSRWLVMDGSEDKGRLSEQIWAKIEPLL